MADKYISKLIPVSHRITLPNVSAQASLGNDSTKLFFGASDNPYEVGLQNGFIKLLWKKTGLSLVKTENEPHPIIPKTMREAVQLLTLLYYDMEDIKDPGQAYTYHNNNKDNTLEALSELNKHQKNLELFSLYFMTTWVNNTLENEQAELVSSVWLADTRLKHKVLCTELLHYIETSERNTTFPRDAQALSTLIQLARQVANSSTYSIGSVKTMLNAVVYIFPDEKSAKMVFALRTVWNGIWEECERASIDSYSIGVRSEITTALNSGRALLNKKKTDIVDDKDRETLRGLISRLRELTAAKE